MKHGIRRVISAPIMLGSFAALAAALAFLAVSAVDAADPAFREVPWEPAVGGETFELYAESMSILHGMLMAEIPAGALVAPLRIDLTTDEIVELDGLQRQAGGPAVVGRVKETDTPIRFSDLDSRVIARGPRTLDLGVVAPTSDGGFVWAGALVSDGAAGLRVRLTGVDLPSGAEIYLLNAAGLAFGPYTGRGPNGEGDFWTHTVPGSEGILVLRQRGPYTQGELTRSSFVISGLGHVSPEFKGISQESFCSFNESCIENASCFNGTPADPAKSAVALMQWISGRFIYTCTGGLIADSDGSSQIPYFLTANHCLSSSSIAQNLETYFQFSISCGSTSCPSQTNPGGIQRLGATLKATGSSGDYTLLQLNQAPPSGSVFLGWNSTPVANTNNAPLYRISHPAWAPQAYSSQVVDTSKPTCSGYPRGTYIYSRDVEGATEGGSSGSPVVNASSQIVGQLFGACGTNVGDPCDGVSNATMDGAFAHYFANVDDFLAGSGCVPTQTTETSCSDLLDNDCDGATDGADSDCAGGSCVNPGGAPKGDSCSLNSQCCSNSCKGKPGAKICK